jgi:hypothetical protein
MNPQLKSLLQSRIFWAALVGLAAIVVQAFLPGFPIGPGENADGLAKMVALLAAYILAEALEGASGRVSGDLRNALRSRKFWSCLVGVVCVLIHAAFPDLPLDEAQVEALVWLIAAYILGVSVDDTGQHLRVMLAGLTTTGPETTEGKP